MSLPIYIRPDRLDLISNSRGYLITAAEYGRALLDIVIKPTSDYKAKAADGLNNIRTRYSNIRLVSSAELDGGDVQEGSIAYYHIFGLIRANSRYDFSTRQLEQDLIAADGDPRIAAHFLHIASGGGEAWYLDRLFTTMQGLTKPIYAHFEQLCASAAYYIACSACRITAETQNCIVGSIGTMAILQSTRGLMEKLGINVQELYAEKSDLKNSKYKEALDGSPERLIAEELNPLRDQFAAAVRSARPSLSELTDDHPILRGEDFSAADGLKNGLIDGICTLGEALTVCADAVNAAQAKKQNRRKALLYI